MSLFGNRKQSASRILGVHIIPYLLTGSKFGLFSAYHLTQGGYHHRHLVIIRSVNAENSYPDMSYAKRFAHNSAHSSRAELCDTVSVLGICGSCVRKLSLNSAVFCLRARADKRATTESVSKLHRIKSVFHIFVLKMHIVSRRTCCTCPGKVEEIIVFLVGRGIVILQPFKSAFCNTNQSAFLYSRISVRAGTAKDKHLNIVFSKLRYKRHSNSACSTCNYSLHKQNLVILINYLNPFYSLHTETAPGILSLILYLYIILPSI